MANPWQTFTKNSTGTKSRTSNSSRHLTAPAIGLDPILAAFQEFRVANGDAFALTPALSMSDLKHPFFSEFGFGTP